MSCDFIIKAGRPVDGVPAGRIMMFPIGKIGFGGVMIGRKTGSPRAILVMETTNLLKPAEQSASDLGKRVKAARQQHDYTLEAASRVCGVSRSTLSKIENGMMSPTFDVLQKIVHGLQIDLGELFGSATKPNAGGRRALTRKDAGQRHAAAGYQMELLATELAHKTMHPFRIRITAHSLDDFQQWGRHEGEEFLFVLSGTVCLYSELYAPTHLEPGDSIYFDSRTGHAAVSTSEEDAEVLWLINETRAGAYEIEQPANPSKRRRKAA
jgi:transcriptional regulator with XRE-family HTH domain